MGLDSEVTSAHSTQREDPESWESAVVQDASRRERPPGKPKGKLERVEMSECLQGPVQCTKNRCDVWHVGVTGACFSLPPNRHLLYHL